MAHPRVVKEYMEAAEIETQYRKSYRAFIEFVVFTDPSRINAPELVPIVEAVVDIVMPDAIACIARLIGEEFTDDDLEALTAFHRSPLAQKRREFTGNMVSAMATYFSDREPQVKAAIDQVLRQRKH